MKNKLKLLQKLNKTRLSGIPIIINKILDTGNKLVNLSESNE
jgi:hypothetical protein